MKGIELLWTWYCRHWIHNHYCKLDGYL